MAFPHACAFAEVAWSGQPSAWSGGTDDTGRPPLRGRVEAHLRRLAAAGVEFRPLAGPRPWQQTRLGSFGDRVKGRRSLRRRDRAGREHGAGGVGGVGDRL